MYRDFRLYLDRMQESAAKVLRFTEGFDHDRFMADDMTFDAVMRNLVIVGAAAGRVPAEVRARYPQVEWRRIVSFGQRARRKYFGVSKAMVWNIVQTDMPVLAAQVQEIRQREGSVNE